MKKRVDTILEMMNLSGVAGEIGRLRRLFAWNCRRRWGRVDRSIVEEYFAQHRTRKLHLGCGTNLLPGWLNTDRFPGTTSVLKLDVTKQFPFKDEEFGYVFCEHMIEHLSYPEGMRMLAECHRVLKRGGKIRISTPDLAFLIDLYRDDRSEIQERYVRWATAKYVRHADESTSVFVINNFVRDWGHKFIYDQDTMRSALEKAGFREVSRRELNRSEDKELCDLENEARMPEGFLRLETFTLEAFK